MDETRHTSATGSSAAAMGEGETVISPASPNSACPLAAQGSLTQPKILTEKSHHSGEREGQRTKGSPQVTLPSLDQGFHSSGSSRSYVQRPESFGIHNPWDPAEGRLIGPTTQQLQSPYNSPIPFGASYVSSPLGSRELKTTQLLPSAQTFLTSQQAPSSQGRAFQSRVVHPPPAPHRYLPPPGIERSAVHRHIVPPLQIPQHGVGHDYKAIRPGSSQGFAESRDQIHLPGISEYIGPVPPPRRPALTYPPPHSRPLPGQLVQNERSKYTQFSDPFRHYRGSDQASDISCDSESSEFTPPSTRSQPHWSHDLSGLRGPYPQQRPISPPSSRGSVGSEGDPRLIAPFNHSSQAPGASHYFHRPLPPRRTYSADSEFSYRRPTSASSTSTVFNTWTRPNRPRSSESHASTDSFGRRSGQVFHPGYSVAAYSQGPLPPHRLMGDLDLSGSGGFRSRQSWEEHSSMSAEDFEGAAPSRHPSGPRVGMYYEPYHYDRDEDRESGRGPYAGYRPRSARSEGSGSASGSGRGERFEEGHRVGGARGVGRGGRKPKRTRVLMTQIQQDKLGLLWKITKFPTTEEREVLAEDVGLSIRQVQVWFQNRRQTFRKQISTNTVPPDADPLDYADLDTSPRTRKLSLEAARASQRERAISMEANAASSKSSKGVQEHDTQRHPRSPPEEGSEPSDYFKQRPGSSKGKEVTDRASALRTPEEPTFEHRDVRRQQPVLRSPGEPLLSHMPGDETRMEASMSSSWPRSNAQYVEKIQQVRRESNAADRQAFGSSRFPTADLRSPTLEKREDRHHSTGEMDQGRSRLRPSPSFGHISHQLRPVYPSLRRSSSPEGLRSSHLPPSLAALVLTRPMRAGEEAPHRGGSILPSLGIPRDRDFSPLGLRLHEKAPHRRGEDYDMEGSATPTAQSPEVIRSPSILKDQFPTSSERSPSDSNRQVSGAPRSPHSPNHDVDMTPRTDQGSPDQGKGPASPAKVRHMPFNPHHMSRPWDSSSQGTSQASSHRRHLSLEQGELSRWSGEERDEAQRPSKLPNFATSSHGEESMRGEKPKEQGQIERIGSAATGSDGSKQGRSLPRLDELFRD